MFFCGVLAIDATTILSRSPECPPTRQTETPLLPFGMFPSIPKMLALLLSLCLLSILAFAASFPGPNTIAHGHSARDLGSVGGKHAFHTVNFPTRSGRAFAPKPPIEAAPSSEPSAPKAKQNLVIPICKRTVPHACEMLCSCHQNILFCRKYLDGAHEPYRTELVQEREALCRPLCECPTEG